MGGKFQKNTGETDAVATDANAIADAVAFDVAADANSDAYTDADIDADSDAAAAVADAFAKYAAADDDDDADTETADAARLGKCSSQFCSQNKHQQNRRISNIFASAE